MTVSKREILLAYKNGKLEELRKKLIKSEIHKKFSIDDEIAILRQKEDKPDEYSAYFTYAEQCKHRVDSLIADTLIK